MKIFITGATGGLGLELCRAFLKDSHEVIGLGRNIEKGAQIEAMGARFIEADLTTFDLKDDLKGVDIIIHAAARTSLWGKYAEFYEDNVIITKKVFLAAKHAKVKGFINISTPSIYTRAKEQLKINEETRVRGAILNDYARTKYEAEKYVMSQTGCGISFISIRPRAIICKDDNVIVPKFLKLLNHEKFPIFNDGEALIEPTDVRDVADFILLCAKNIHQIKGQVFNISGGKSMSVKEIVELISKAMGKEVKFKNTSYNNAAFFIKLQESIYKILPNCPEPPLTHYSLVTLSFSQTFNLAKINKKLGFTPKYDAFETIEQIATSLKNNDDIKA